MASDDFFPWEHTNDPLDQWWESIVDPIDQFSIRLGSAVISGALAIAASNMFTAGQRLATPTLAASGLFAAAFAASAAGLTLRRPQGR
jgi:hypothetical protein